MGTLGRVGVALAALLGFTALLGAQTAGASKPKSDLAVYQALNQTLTSFGVQFTVPKYTCTATNDSVNAYADAFDTASANPNAFDGAYVQLDCTTKKRPLIVPFLEVDGTFTQPSGLTIRKGDTMVINVTCNSSGSSVELTDETTDVSQSATSDSAASCNGVFMGNIASANAKGKVVPLPSFGSVDFTNAVVDGADYSTFNPTAVNLNEGSDGKVKVGPLNVDSWVNTEKS
jgi:peptidase A4-like protein